MLTLNTSLNMSKDSSEITKELDEIERLADLTRASIDWYGAEANRLLAEYDRSPSPEIKTQLIEIYRRLTREQVNLDNLSTRVNASHLKGH